MPKNIVPKVKHGGVLVLFLGCLSSIETGYLIAIKEKIDSDDYIVIL